MADKIFPLGDGATAQKFKDMGDGTHAPIVYASGPGGGLQLGGYDAINDVMKVSSFRKNFRDDFSGASLSATKWASSVGVGGALAVTGGQLQIDSGTTAGSVTSITSVDTFRIPFRVKIHLLLSQRIANQDFIVEAVSVDPVTLQPDGLNALGLKFNGTTATMGFYFVQNGGGAALDSSALTFHTTAGGGMLEIEPFLHAAWFHGSSLDSTGGRKNRYRRPRN